MLLDRFCKTLRQHSVLAGLLGGLTLGVVTASAMTGGPEIPLLSVRYLADTSVEQAKVESAAARFVRGMVAKDVDAVWMFASEEDQDAFGTEQAVYDAFAEVFPVLAAADRMTIERVWQEGDTPFVEATVHAGRSGEHRATMGFWLDDAGDWKLVSCDVKSAADLVAGL